MNQKPKSKSQQADYGIFCEGDRLEAYRFIQSYHEIFGTRWLLRKFNICPNAYYNYLKDRKKSYYCQKQETLAQIKSIFFCTKCKPALCTDFTYLFLKDGSVRYNCAILDLHDRSIISSITDKEITSDLAIRTLKKALQSQPKIKGELILHSDQGSQYTSHAFTSYCESAGVIQSISKAGYPYDNAPMERYYNTLKNELIYQHEYKTPFEARYSK